MIIKVFGIGCPKCKEAEAVIKEAVCASGVNASVEKVMDIKEMMTAGVLTTPAVSVDGTIVCSGRIPSKSEVMGWIATPDANVLGGSASSGCCCGGKC